jgi:hypothetical protein
MKNQKEIKKKRRENKTHLKFYEKCMKTGIMPKMGLCTNADTDYKSLDEDLLGEIFQPTDKDYANLRRRGRNAAWWGYDKKDIVYSSVLSDQEYYEYNTQKKYGFNPLRQNIVLFMAAMNGEL